MSGNELRQVAMGETAGKKSDQQLIHFSGGSPSDQTLTRSTRDVVSDELLSSVVVSVAEGESDVDDSLVTESLVEILLAMIELSTDGTHGTELMDELERQFDARLSPGTIYPRLHELEADGVLEKHELVQTKQYSIEDSSAAESMIRRAAYQHLAIGTFLQASLDAT